MSPPSSTTRFLRTSIHEFKFVRAQQYSRIFLPGRDRFTTYIVSWFFGCSPQELQSDIHLLLAGSPSVQHPVRLGDPRFVAPLGKQALRQFARLFIHKIV